MVRQMSKTCEIKGCTSGLVADCVYVSPDKEVRMCGECFGIHINYKVALERIRFGQKGWKLDE